jgi:hypothetical protein
LRGDFHRLPSLPLSQMTRIFVVLLTGLSRTPA